MKNKTSLVKVSIVCALLCLFLGLLYPVLNVLLHMCDHAIGIESVDKDDWERAKWERAREERSVRGYQRAISPPAVSTPNQAEAGDRSVSLNRQGLAIEHMLPRTRRKFLLAILSAMAVLYVELVAAKRQRCS